MKTSEVLKLLKKNGFKLDHHGGNHDFYRHPVTGRIVMIHRHKTEIKTKTLQSILKSAGIKD